ncbi:MAG: phage replisome organizer N-terminal domain-containing protein [Methanobrevibacter sp.]|nr:phage replisome organizer N-terminal domain-containing protein [Methanobrevibacter sp.]
MSDNKKYYYLKLKEDFFNSEEMMILESMKNGAEYQNVYLKLCLLSLKSDGALIFKNMLPYSVEMLSSVLRINIDTVKTAIELFQKLGLISITDTETIYMTDIQTLVGQSSTEAERVKKYRQTLAQKKSEAKLIESTPAEEIIEEEQCQDEVVQEIKEEIPESRTEGVQMYEECTEMLQNCTPENRDKRLELRDKSLNINNNSEEIAVISGKAAKKKTKANKIDSIPREYYKRALAIYFSNYKKVRQDNLELFTKNEYPETPIINYGYINRRLFEHFTNFGVEKVLDAIRESVNHQWLIERGYPFGHILGPSELPNLINKTYKNSNYNNKYFDKSKLDDKPDLSYLDVSRDDYEECPF